MCDYKPFVTECRDLQSWVLCLWGTQNQLGYHRHGLSHGPRIICEFIHTSLNLPLLLSFPFFRSTVVFYLKHRCYFFPPSSLVQDFIFTFSFFRRSFVGPSTWTDHLYPTPGWTTGVSDLTVGTGAGSKYSDGEGVKRNPPTGDRTCESG